MQSILQPLRWNMREQTTRRARAGCGRPLPAPRRRRTCRHPPRTSTERRPAQRCTKPSDAREWRSFLYLVAEHVALVSSRDDAMRFGSIDFSAQAVDIDLDEIRKRVKVRVPHMFGDLGAADDAAGAPNEIFE